MKKILIRNKQNRLVRLLLTIMMLCGMLLSVGCQAPEKDNNSTEAKNQDKTRLEEIRKEVS